MTNNNKNTINEADYSNKSDLIKTNAKSASMTLTISDIKLIRKIIRQEIAEIYFTLYRKRSVWK